MPLIGIINENEFYSDHYLAEIFAGDIRGVLETWQTRENEAREAARARGEGGTKYAGYRTPANRLAGQAREFLQRIEDSERQRQPEDRIQAARALYRPLAAVFELPFEPRRVTLDDGAELPLLGELRDPRGAPLLWLLEALPGADEEPDQDPLSCRVLPQQLESLADEPLPKDVRAADAPDWQKRLGQQVFVQTRPPRWVLLAGPRQWLLLDRAKYAQHRLLRFNWVELFGRRETESLKAVSVLLHRESLLDSQGQALLDSLDENAHKHAYAVSEDLKYALRECIELLGNEAAAQLEERTRRQSKSIYSGAEALDAGDLSLECLRWMYRLLFLFYIEARPELGYAPVASETYLKGYALEHLRELELVPLTGEAERNGRYFHHSLETLFRLVGDGYPADRYFKGAPLPEGEGPGVRGGGFDLILGNPPWIKVEWSSGDVLGDFEPRFVIRKMTAPQLAKLREETFERIPELKRGWTDEFEESEGTQNFLNAQVNYPQLRGVQTNLYKCFLPRAWANGSGRGVSAFLHPEGVYDDPKGGAFRRELYQRLRAHHQYQNEKKLWLFRIFRGAPQDIVFGPL